MYGRLPKALGRSLFRIYLCLEGSRELIFHANLLCFTCMDGSRNVYILYFPCLEGSRRLHKIDTEHNSKDNGNVNKNEEENDKINNRNHFA